MCARVCVRAQVFAPPLAFTEPNMNHIFVCYIATNGSHNVSANAESETTCAGLTSLTMILPC